MADSLPSSMSCPRRTEHTDKWSEVIKNSYKITNAPLKKYRLNTVEEKITEDGLVRKCTFGKKDKKKRNKTILLVGETGAGKSTLINRMLNYMLGVKWEDDVRFEIITDEGEKPQTETVETTAYEIYGLEEFSVHFSLTVIDTPGFGNLRGNKHDKCIAENLYTLMKSFSDVQQIDAACFVVKASENRLCDRQKYIFDSMLSLFGKNMEKNIMILITHSDWGPPQALEAIVKSGVPLAKDENGEPVHFPFNNHPLEKPVKKFAATYIKCWENGAKSMHHFFQSLDQIETKKLNMTKKVLKKHLRLDTSIKSLKEQAGIAERKQIALEENKTIIEKYNKDTPDHKLCVHITTEAEISDKATRCIVCQVNCHYPGCWWVSDPKWCSVIKNSYCTVCPRKCHYTDHVKDNKIYKETWETYEDLKKKGKMPATEGMMDDLQRQLEEAEAEKAKLMEEAYQCIVKLKECALKFKTDSTKRHMVYLIDMFSKAKDTEKPQFLKNML